MGGLLLGHPELTNNYPKPITVFTTTIWSHEPYTKQILTNKYLGKYFELRFFIYIEDVLTETLNFVLMMSTIY